MTAKIIPFPSWIDRIEAAGGCVLRIPLEIAEDDVPPPATPSGPIEDSPAPVRQDLGDG